MPARITPAVARDTPFAGRITPMANCVTPSAGRITTTANCVTPTAGRITPISDCVTPISNCLTPTATGVTQFEIGVMQIAAGVMQTVMDTAQAGAGVSRVRAEETRISAIAMATLLGALHRKIAVLPMRRRMLPARGGVSSVAGSVLRAGLAIDRGDLAGTGGLDAEAPFPDEVLENPVEGAAVRLVAERSADVTARERLGKALQRDADVVFQLSGAPAPGPARGRKRRRRLLLRRRWCRSGLRRNRDDQPSSGLTLEHPHQLESPDLRLVGGLQQLDAGAELLLQPLLVLFVLIACHGVEHHNTSEGQAQGLPLREIAQPSLWFASPVAAIRSCDRISPPTPKEPPLTTPSAFLRRRLGRVAIAVSCLFAGTFALWACGPFFPHWLLGPERLLTPAPEGLLRHEIERLKMAESPRAVPANDPWAQTSEAGVADLRKALERVRLPDGVLNHSIAAYTKVRDALSKYASAVTVFENVSEPLDPAEEMGGGEPSEPPVFPRGLQVPERIPFEFGDYLRGAIAYHQGDLEAAISTWEALLQRPEDERRFRSTWAAFMLGKTHLRAKRPAEAVRWFERTREIAGQKDFVDSLGLAAASLGWEARAERDQGHFDKALALYARQGKGGDSTAMSSLRFVARQALKAGPEALAPIARSAEARPVMTAFLVSDAKAPWEMYQLEEEGNETGRTPRIKSHVAAWLAALQKAGVKDVDGADRIAWAAYQGGDFAAARQWLDRAPGDAPMTRWIRARLLLRDGKLAEAQKLLDQTAATLPDPQLTQDELDFHSEWAEGGKIATPSLASSESAVLLTTQGKYVEALDRFLKSGFWVDAAHIAEQVLTVDELKAYVDAHWPASLVKDLPEEEWFSYNEGLETAPSNHIAHDLRNLLGRRLARAGRLGEAQPYLPAEMETSLGSLREALLHTEEPGQPDGRRAAAYFRAACVTRKQGLELLGTELDPDWYLFEGQYEMNYRKEMAARAENPHLKPGPGELEKTERTRPEPDKRFHYRYRAAELARKAADLLPDGSDQKARYLATAGTWLKARDADAARPFFKALLDCCAETKLGQAAQRARWFPEVPECEAE